MIKVVKYENNIQFICICLKFYISCRKSKIKSLDTDLHQLESYFYLNEITTEIMGYK